MMRLLNKMRNNKVFIPLVIIGITIIYYLFIHNTYSVLDNRQSELFWWMEDSWNVRNNLEHGYAVPIAFIVFCVSAYKSSRGIPESNGKVGIAFLIFGLLLYLASARTIQPRLALIGLPFMIAGGIIYALGWQKGKYFLFASFFWYFALPVPGLNQLTNGLQVIITEWCYHCGLFFGMDIIQSGNTINSGNGSWPGFNIAEGCSGIKSLMALFMIAAIYAYYTQVKLWKKVLVLASALPLAIVGNFFRVFTILVLAEMGYGDFAAGAYHDWAGLLVFFPVALSGLFAIDKILNRKKKTLKKTIQS